jgi:hypothetical protein
VRGKKTDPRLVDEIRRLRTAHRPAEIVKIMEGRLSRRSVYRVLQRLKREDELRRRELAEQTRLALEREEAERRRRAKLRGVRPYKTVAQFPPRVRVRAE